MKTAMKIIHKVTSTVLAFSFLLASNFCLVECVFAVEDHDHGVQVSEANGHHHESDGDQDHSGSDKHEPGTTCCSSLVAVKASSSDATDTKLIKQPFSQAVVLERLASQLSNNPVYKVEFPPGASPPAAFLLNHFTHAPPSSL